MLSRLRAALFPPPNHENTDNPLGSAFALTVLAVFVQGLSRFGYSVLVARLLGQDALGDVNLIISLALFCVLLWPQACGTAAAKFIAMARGREDPQQQLATAWTVVLSAITGALVVGVGACVYAAAVLHLSPAHALSAGALVLALALYYVAKGVRTGNNQFVTTTAWDTISSFTTLTLLVLVLWGNWHWALLLPLVLGYVLYALPALPSRPDVQLDPGIRREILRFTGWSSAHLLAASGLLQLSVVLAGMFSPATLGLYAAAVALATPASMLSSAMLTALSPSVARLHAAGGSAELTAQVDRILRTMVVVFLPVFGVGALWAGPLLGLVFGPAFRAAEPLLVVLFLAVSATSFNAANARLNGTEAWGVKVLAAANGIGLALGTVTVLALAPEHGAMASAVGYLAGSLLSALLPLLVVWRLDRLRWGGVLLRVLAGYAMVLGGLALLRGDFQLLPTVLVTVTFLSAWLLISMREVRRLLRALVPGRDGPPPEDRPTA